MGCLTELMIPCAWCLSCIQYSMLIKKSVRYLALIVLGQSILGCSSQQSVDWAKYMTSEPMNEPLEVDQEKIDQEVRIVLAQGISVGMHYLEMQELWGRPQMDTFDPVNGYRVEMYKQEIANTWYMVIVRYRDDLVVSWNQVRVEI